MVLERMQKRKPRLLQHKLHLVEEREEKEKESTFLLTINSNQIVPSLNHPLALQFKEDVTNMVSNLPEFISVREGFLADLSMDITVKPAFEIGSHQHRLHSHIVINIKHNSNIQLNVKKISKALGGMYVNATFIRGNRDLKRALDYIHKNS